MNQETAVVLSEKDILKGIEEFDGNLINKDALARVSDSEDVLEIMAKMKLDPNKLHRLIEAIDHSEQLNKHYDQISQEGQEILAMVPKLLGAVSLLHWFVSWLESREPDGIRAVIPLSFEEKVDLRAKLHFLKRLIQFQETIELETPMRIGATRKATAQSVATSWLAASIKRITGRSHFWATSILAEKILQIPQVTEDQIRRALRNMQREWRRA